MVHILPNILFKPLILRYLHHSSAVGAGLIPVLPTVDKIQNKYNAAARMGINPTTTVDVCNTLISNVLTTLSFHHKNIVNVIPLLDEERQRWPSAVKWYATVVVDFCRSLTRQCPIQTTDTKILTPLIRRRGGVYPRPTSCGQDTEQI